MTLCPKCKAMTLTTPVGEVCQNCGWSSNTTAEWTPHNAVNLPLIIPEESWGTRTLETDINDLTIRVSALEADMERLKRRIPREPVILSAEGHEKVKEDLLKALEKSNTIPVIDLPEPLALKPCPFCDSIDIGTYEPTAYEVGDDASVECQKCGAEIRASTLREAITKWNRRVGE